MNQLRLLRHEYPQYWELMLKWDNDSKVTFKSGSRGKPGHTVHDFDRRFALEDEGLIDPEAPFKWSMLDQELNYQFKTWR